MELDDASGELDSAPIDLERLGDRLSGVRLCTPAAVERMRQSLSRHGQLVAVTAFDDGQLLQVVDGFKRIRAAQRLGWRSLRVCVLDLGEAEAAATIVALHQRGKLTELEESWLVRWLYREHDLSQGTIAKLMGKHKSWVSRRLTLVELLDTAVQADVRLGLLSARAALSVSALPRGNQQSAAELIMNNGMTTRQAEILVRDLRTLDSDEVRRVAIEQWPASGGAMSGDGRRAPRSDADKLLADVATLTRVGVRLEVRLLDSPLAGLGSGGREPVTKALKELSTLLGGLDRALERALLMQDRADATLAYP